MAAAITSSTGHRSTGRGSIALVVVLGAGLFGTSASARGVVFVNFDGVTLTAGPTDDARTDTTQLEALATTFAPYGDGEEREAVLQAVRASFAAYDVFVTDVRPDSGDYVMSVTSPTNPLADAPEGAILGLAPLDCDDARTSSNVTFAFHGAGDEFSAAATATTIAQEVAHSFGLEHVDDPRDIMFALNLGGPAQFVDECLPVTPDAEGEIHCKEQHAAQCGESDLQNGHAELLALFGPRPPEGDDPLVEITAPEDGEVLAAGEDIEIHVAVAEDAGSPIVRLVVDGEDYDADEDRPYGWTIVDPPPGTYEIHVEALAAIGDFAVGDSITITIEEEIDPQHAIGGALPPSYGPGFDGVGGCTCALRSHGPAGFGPPGIAVLLLAAFARREPARRRARI